MSMISLLAHHIRTHGPVPTVRVSSAQASGRAKKYAYWGVVRYELRLSRDGRPLNVALHRAGSDRRSERLAESDADALAAREGRIRCRMIGRLDESTAIDVLDDLGGHDDAIARHIARGAARDAARPLTLAERLLLRQARRAMALVAGRVRGLPSEPPSEDDVRAGRIIRRGRWISLRRAYTHDVYLPWGDSRDAEEFRGERNQHRRWLIAQASGDRCQPPRTLVQADDYGQLYDVPRVTSWGIESHREVRVVCPSTGREYWLPVDRKCRTAHEAVAATFGLAVVAYRPVAEA